MEPLLLAHCTNLQTASTTIKTKNTEQANCKEKRREGRKNPSTRVGRMTRRAATGKSLEGHVAQAKCHWHISHIPARPKHKEHPEAAPKNQAAKSLPAAPSSRRPLSQAVCAKRRKPALWQEKDSQTWRPACGLSSSHLAMGQNPNSTQ